MLLVMGTVARTHPQHMLVLLRMCMPELTLHNGGASSTAVGLMLCLKFRSNALNKGMPKDQ